MMDTICETCVRVREGLCDGEKELTVCQYYKGMTNFDKHFRFTSEEKLAELLVKSIFTMRPFCPVVQNDLNPGFCDMDCKKCVAEWLKRGGGGMSEQVKDYPPYLDYPKPRKKQTNADRIRAMSDEELAEAIYCRDDCAPANGYCCADTSCYLCKLNWLKQEVSDNG